VYAEVPPRVEYDLTDLGRAFHEPVAGLCRWAQGHEADLEAALANRRRSRQRKPR
jgi:DNA-binding HxlR family transcriptional regulator